MTLKSCLFRPQTDLQPELHLDRAITTTTILSLIKQRVFADVLNKNLLFFHQKVASICISSRRNRTQFLQKKNDKNLQFLILFEQQGEKTDEFLNIEVYRC